MHLWCQSCFNLFLPFMGRQRSQTLAFHSPCEAKGSQRNEVEQPCSVSVLSRKEKRRMGARFRKRRQTFVKSAHKLHQDCDVDVYVAVRKGGRFFSYSSTDDDSWRPSNRQAGELYSSPTMLTPQSFESLDRVENEALKYSSW